MERNTPEIYEYKAKIRLFAEWYEWVFLGCLVLNAVAALFNAQWGLGVALILASGSLVYLWREKLGYARAVITLMKDFKNQLVLFEGLCAALEKIKEDGYVVKESARPHYDSMLLSFRKHLKNSHVEVRKGG